MSSQYVFLDYYYYLNIHILPINSSPQVLLHYLSQPEVVGLLLSIFPCRIAWGAASVDDLRNPALAERAPRTAQNGAAAVASKLDA
jgi:hypothetical protein